jgi:predicted DNA-binding transcriptional regulator AlpA
MAIHPAKQNKTRTNAAPAAEPVWVSEFVAGDRIGTTAETLRRWRFEKRGPRYAKVGSSVRYNLADLDNWIARHIVETRDSGQTAQENLHRAHARS